MKSIKPEITSAKPNKKSNELFYKSHLAKVTLLGLDDPDQLTPKTASLIAETEVLAASPRWLSAFPQGSEIRLPLNESLDEFLNKIKDLSKHKRIVIIASGDPNFFGLAKKLLTFIAPEDVAIIPATTTIQKAFARLKTTWAGVETVSLHGRSSWRNFWSALFRAGLKTGPGRLAVFTDPSQTPAFIAQRLLEKGLKAWEMIVFEDLDSPREKISRLGLDKASQSIFSPLNLVVLELVTPYAPLIFGAPEESYLHEEGLITKSEIRSATLGFLEFTGDETLWDLGSGSGSVSLEAAFLLPYGEIWAVEKNPNRAEQIRDNRARFGVSHLEIITGETLKVLNQLPLADRIFIGGGGSELELIIHEAKKKLKPGGIIVAAAITIEALTQATKAMSQLQSPQITQISAARSSALGQSLYLKPLNQIWLVKERKPQPDPLFDEAICQPMK